MARVGRKISSAFKKVGRKIVAKRGAIGGKIAKIGRVAGRIAPFLAAVPGVGLGGAALASAASGAAVGAGNAIRASSLKQAGRSAAGVGRSLAETYAAHRAA